MNWKHLKRALLIPLLCGTASLTSCSAFFGGTDGMNIQNIVANYDEDGNTVILVTYLKDDVETTTTFTIPRGMAGTDGNGIADILAEAKKTDTGMEIELTIVFTDGREPLIVTVPVYNGVDGTDGKGIAEVNVDTDEIGNTVVTFLYTDGEEESFTIQKGKDGNGIADIRVDKNPDGYTIVIAFTNGDIYDFPMEVPKAQSIVSIVQSGENDSQYFFLVTFSDETTTTFSIAKPQATVWHSGKGDPDPSIGKVDDFYLNETNGEVWKKGTFSWQFVFRLNIADQNINHRVTYFPNGGTWVSDSKTDERITTAKHGVYLSDLFDGQDIVKDGYTFAGWWTNIDLSDVNAGHLTTLTPILDDLSVWARWAEVEA
ncbi:MAG: hypothetical protein ACI32C_02745 [Candidatus Enteromonas sp.]